MIQLRDQGVTSLNRPIVGDKFGRSQQDAIMLGGRLSPGFCTVRSAERVYTWDTRKGFGYSGATSIFTGEGLAQVAVEFRILTEEQLGLFSSFQKDVLLPNLYVAPQQNSAFLPLANKPKALGCFHPSLADLGITALVVLKVSQWSTTPGPGFGLWKKQVEFMQWRPPVAVKRKLAAPAADGYGLVVVFQDVGDGEPAAVVYTFAIEATGGAA